MKYFFAAALALVLVSVCTTPASSQPGSTGMTFLKLGVGARSLGMGEAYTAVANDPTATYYNPAALVNSSSNQISLMHRAWIQDAKTEYISGQSELIGLNIGFAINVTSIDNIEYRNVPGPALGTFSSRNASAGVSAAYSFDTAFALGATVNYLYEKLFTNEATGMGFNFGALYRTPWSFDLGASVNNLGTMNALGQDASKLPSSLRIGAAKTLPVESLNGSLTVAADYLNYTAESSSHLHAGAELNYRNQFQIRAGYLTGYEGRSFTGGIGVEYQFLQFDYAFAPFKYDLGSTHTFSLGFVF